MDEDPVIALLRREQYVAADCQGRRHRLDPVDTARAVIVELRGDAPDIEYVIQLEEFRGGEGYEDEVLRSRRAGEVLVAIGKHTAWAREPFRRPRTWWQRLRGYLGQA